jgi:hypothetical protein
LIRAAQAAKLTITGVTLKDGVVTLVVEAGTGTKAAGTDAELEEFEARHET